MTTAGVTRLLSPHQLGPRKSMHLAIIQSLYCESNPGIGASQPNWIFLASQNTVALRPHANSKRSAPSTPIRWLLSTQEVSFTSTLSRVMPNSRNLAWLIFKAVRLLNNPTSRPYNLPSKILLYQQATGALNPLEALAHARLHRRPGLWAMIVCQLCRPRQANISRMALGRELGFREEDPKTPELRAQELLLLAQVSRPSPVQQMLAQSPPRPRVLHPLYVCQSSPRLHSFAAWLLFSPRSLALRCYEWASWY